MPAPIPVFILSGFLGAGKTTLLNYILHHQTTHRIAIIENEFGDTHLDTQLLSRASSPYITTLQNGCICCNSHAELGVTLFEFINQLDQRKIIFDQLIIECTGMADPGPIIQTFLTHELFSERFEIRGVITLVDVINTPYQFKHFHVTQAQIGFADLILLSKTDLLHQNYDDFIKQLKYMNSKADIYPVLHGKIDLTLLNQLNGFSLNTKNSLPFTCQEISSNILDTKVNSFVITRHKPFELQSLSLLIEKILNLFEKQLLRYKAIIHIKDHSQRLILQGVKQLYNSEWGEKWLNSETPFSEFVFIGIELPEQEFRRAFDEI